MLNKMLLIGALVLTVGQSAVAGKNTLADFEPGFYLGAQGGLAKINEGNGPEARVDHYYNHQYSHFSNKTKSTKKGGFGGRLFAGYSFTPNFAMDFGVTLYPGNKYKLSAGPLDLYKFKSNFYTVDAMFKGILPLEMVSNKLTGWNVYAKAGSVLSILNYKHYYQGSEKTHTAINVTLGYGLGVGYNFTDHLGIDFSWAGVLGIHKLTDAGNGVINYWHDVNGADKTVPSANMFALGVTYKF